MKKVLVIEDETVLRTALKMKLEKEFEVLTASNGKEGLEIALREHPDFIVLDLIMPVMGGEEFVELIHEDEWGKTSKAVVLSNLMEHEVNGYKFMLKSSTRLDDLLSYIQRHI